MATEHLCDKEARISVLENRICRIEKDVRELREKNAQLDKTLDSHAEINVRIEAKLDRIDESIKELKEERKTTKTFWRDKWSGILSSIITGVTLAYLLIRFGLK